MKVAWLDSGWMYCLYTFSQSLLSGYRGFGQATRWWGIPKKHRQAKRLEQHHRQGLDTFICTHHGHFHADEAQPNMTQCMFCIAFCGVFVSFGGKIFHQDLDWIFFFLETFFFLVRRRPRAGHGLCHAEMSGCRVAVAPLASISWSACIFIETPVKHMETFRKDHWMKRQILEKLHHFSAFFPIFLLVEHRDSTDRSQRAPMSWGLDEFQGLPILRTREAQEIDKANSVATELDCSVIFGI